MDSPPSTLGSWHQPSPAADNTSASANGFAELAEFSPDGIFVNQEDYFVYANPAALKMLQASSLDQVVGHCVFDFIPVKDHALAKERIARVRAGVPDALLEGQLLRLDGTIMDVEIAAAPVRWHNQSAIQVLVRDISERKRMQQALKDGEERFRGLVEATAQTVWEANADGEVVIVSPTWCAYTGQRKEDFQKGGWIQAVHPDDKDAVLRQWHDALATKRPYNAEYRLRHCEEEWRWTNARATPVLDEDGTVRKWVGMNIDITEQKIAEARLRDNEARFRRALQPQNVGVLFFDSDRTITDANDAFLRMSGYGREELASRQLRWDRMTPPEWMEDSLRAVEEFKSKGYSTPYEKQYIRKDGSRWWGLFAGTCVSESESVEYVIDISRQKHIEQALRESEARFRALAEASPALIWQLDHQRSIAYLNQRYLDVTGLTPEQLRESGWAAIVHPEDLPGYLMVTNETPLGHGSSQRRARIRTRDGQWRWFESYVAPWFAASGECRGYVGISIDVTETARAEESLKEADRRKDEFLATLAHELRNPLAPISNAVHLLRRPDGRRTADRIIEMVGRQVNHIVRLVDDLLEVSRVTRGKIELSKAPVELADIVAGAIEISRPVIDQAHHELAVSLPEEPLIVYGDKVRLTQVLVNLLANAAKYTDSGGQIRISALREDDALTISVRDNGTGIAPDQLPHVFSMFTQFHRVVGRGFGGLGIGLTMARSLVEMHGGEISAHSAGPNQGSEFTVRLPLVDTEHQTSAQHTPSVPNATAPLFGRRILVVDDNRDAADSLGMLLECDGAMTEIVYDGNAALAAIEANLPHVVLLDIGMPGMDGHEVAQAIRRDQRFNGVRLVALTGWGQQADRLRTQRSGFDYHLTKPVDYPALQKLLKEMPGAGETQ